MYTTYKRGRTMGTKEKEGKKNIMLLFLGGKHI
jgi:hypothetical protein